MKRWFARQPIRNKLIALILGTSVVVVLLESAGHLMVQYDALREDAAADLHTQARVILEAADAPISFENYDEAQATLNLLGSSASVRTACLYDRFQDLVAHYEKPDALPCPKTAPQGNARQFEADRIVVLDSVVSDGNRTSTIYIRSDVGALQQRLQDQAIVIGVVMVIAFGVAVLLSARLQALVSEPIVELSRTAARIGAQGDYSLRARRRTDDEVGVLVDAFNGMVERIEAREAELSRTNEDLRHEVAERRRAEQERAELLVREREANRLKDEFLATLSHELRTPLNAILGWTKLLRGRTLPEDSFDRALEKVERNAQVQARLVEDLLEVSRIVTGKLRLDIRQVDLAALATTAIDSIRPAAEARGVSIERAFGAVSLPTAGDPDRLQQVIWNLLSNAVKFTPSGGRVRLSITRDGDADVLVVSDTGVGIDPEFLPHVFDTFRQADASPTRAHGGLGLGLAIVRQLVQLHGGSVTARSDGRDRGATFTVRLPVRTIRGASPSALGDSVSTSVLAGTTVLAVDDDDDTRELLQSVLESAGARVVAAASAADAFLACNEHHPDAIVSDIGMPGRDGYSLLQDLRAAFGAASPRVAIALSAYAGPQDRARSLAVGFQRHLAKPFDPAGLVQLLRELLDETPPVPLTGG